MSEQLAVEYPNLHCLIYGEPGAGKTTFAATWPTPALVLFFDPYAKEMAFLQGGTAQTEADGVPLVTSTGAPMTRIWEGDKLKYQVEYYHETKWTVSNDGDLVPTPEAYERMAQRLVTIDREIMEGYWKTLIVDSLTYLEMAMKARSRYKINLGSKYDARHHGGIVRMAVESLVMNRLASLRCNVVITAHEKIYEEDLSKDPKRNVPGDIIRCPNTVGSLGKLLGSPFSELYRIVNDPAKGRYLQTQKDYMWPASSTFAPNPCAPNYGALWSGRK